MYHVSCIDVQSHYIVGSAGKREEESPEEALYYNTHIFPILDKMQGQDKGSTYISIAKMQL